MSEPFLGEIRMVGFNFAPNGWLSCNGQALSIAQNSALFALLGVTFGGDGVNTFNLPDYRGRVPTGQGQGPGTDNIVQGEKAGTPSTVLTNAQLPTHTHTAAFAGTPTSGAASISVGTTSTSAIVNPTNGSTAYLCAAAADYGGDAVTIKGLYSSTPPAAGATASLGGGTLDITPQGTVNVAAAGSSQPVSLYQPFTGTNFIIATEGIFPSRP